MYVGVMAAADGRGSRSAHLEDVPDLRRRLWNRHDDLSRAEQTTRLLRSRAGRTAALGFRHAVWPKAAGTKVLSRENARPKREAVSRPICRAVWPKVTARRTLRR